MIDLKNQFVYLIMVKKEVVGKGEQKKDSTGLVLALIFLFLLFVVLVFLVYLLYLNLPGESVKGLVMIKGQDLTGKNYSARQFYPNMKFNHNNISYSIDINCKESKKDNVFDAFHIVESRTPLSFYEDSINPDIEISCSEINLDIDESHFIAGEGGAKEIVQTGRYNIINEGIILLYNSDNSKIDKCDYPHVELHELMHVFGFNHTENKGSLMYPYLESCEQILDESIVGELNILYSQENLPDFYFKNLSAVREGRRLDFNLTIKNSGVVASSTTLSIFERDKLVKTIDLEEIGFGAGITLDIKNLNLLYRNSEEIKFVIDSDNKIKEINKKNNVAIINFK